MFGFCQVNGLKIMLKYFVIAYNNKKVINLLKVTKTKINY